MFGSTGLVGSSLVKQLSLDNQFQIFEGTRRNVDLFNLDETSKFIEKNRPDVVINAAAKVGGIVANNTQRLEFILENLKINMNILEACIPFNQIKIINLGSSCIYPLNSENPIRESLIMSGKLEPTNSPYAMAKLTAIEIGDALSRQLGHEVINLMPTNLYGPNDNFHPLNSHVIPGLINRFHNSKLNNESEISIWGDGSPLREFLYVDDLADAIKFIIQNKISDNLINVGSSMEISISKLASLIAETVQYNGSIVYDTTKPNGNNRKLLDNSLINSYGWKAKTTLEAGLRLTYDWYLKNIDSLRS
ncbi:MAG: GDP-L-fucose synthase [Flavobacteriales bacterium]|nr:GDP-L-fucose synthase [Flavobacteriales bacterium]